MSRSNAKKLGYMAAGAALLALFAAQGCGSDSDEQVKPTAGAAGAHSTAGAGGKTTAGAGGKTSTTAGKGGADETGGTAPSDGGAPDMPGEGGAGGEGGAVDCGGGDECYSCTPTTNDQLLNHCVPGGCPATFNNKTLTKLNLVGTL
jgi:hypothetical protein